MLPHNDNVSDKNNLTASLFCDSKSLFPFKIKHERHLVLFLVFNETTNKCFGSLDNTAGLQQRSIHSSYYSRLHENMCPSFSAPPHKHTQSVGRGNFLVTFGGVPAGDFVVRLKGELSSSTSRSIPSSFQRQASTQIKTSSISVTVSAVTNCFLPH